MKSNKIKFPEWFKLDPGFQWIDCNGNVNTYEEYDSVNENHLYYLFINEKIWYNSFNQMHFRNQQCADSYFKVCSPKV